MFDVQKLSDVVTTHTGPSPHGCTCKFIKLDDNWGIKCYKWVSIRNRAFADQKKMAEYGYAPQVGASFEVGDKYCYITQMAVPLCEGDEDYDRNYPRRIRETKEKFPEIDNMISSLCNDMNAKGYYMGDTHYANWGFIDGKLVCIDFS